MLRILKQFVFGIFFVAVFGGVGFWIYHTVTYHEPTCFDKIQNQGEEDVDCGLICGNVCLSLLKPLEVRESYLFKIKDEVGGLADYDGLFQVTNLNTKFGAEAVNYELSIVDSVGASLLKKTGQFYILPGQTKYIYEPTLRTRSSAVRAELKITTPVWQELTGIFREDVGFTVKSKDYIVNDRPGIFSRVNGIMFNASDFDFDRVNVVVVLFKDGQPVGAGSTILTTFPAKSDRFYEITWVNPLPTPDRVEIEANTNVFENSNFLRKYGIPERFQQP